MAYLEHTKNDPYVEDVYGTAHGITFHLPSRRRFIPNSWLIYSELNEKQTELRLHYMHAVVVVSGTNLIQLLERLENFRLRIVRELPQAPARTDTTTVTRIEITEKTDD